MSGKLYVIGTPIGNLEDMSLRAARMLGSVDFIAAEDTRVSVKLLNHLGIKKEMISYHEHNKFSKENVIIKRLLEGETCGIVTDAGMPAISDPGEDLVRSCRELGIAVESVPGPSAVITALAISGLPTKRFAFEGFLSANKKERQSALETLRGEERTLVFYEAPHKLKATLNDMLNILGDRKIALAKELTKLHENVEITTLKEAVEKFETSEPKGEFVLILAPKEADREKIITLEQAVIFAKEQIAAGLSVSAAAKEAASISGIKKGDIYKELI